jgi:hypothetical protein
MNAMRHPHHEQPMPSEREESRPTGQRCLVS